MEATLSVKRYDPEADRQGPYYQEYGFEIDENATVLDGLIKVREEIDGCLLYTSPSPRDGLLSRMPSSA